MSRVARPFVVLDTNVLVSGFLNPYGAPAAILRPAVRGQIRLVYDARIFAEYTKVLLRPKFRLAEGLLRTVLDMLREQGLGVVALPLPVRLPEPADEPFLEVAPAAGRDVPLITGNVRHFPENLRQGVPIVTLREWLDRYRE
ncbi:putative toxin-antitoxin system toxin component, PIN family [Kyrpidia spormannii]|uniref:Nucleic acid binding protein n=1 Tax=Kyrpidia spormannii TaxID=2055160 RepID=A0ACA8ZFP8_9BACL|nr:putative toxin-antitoxin system toxin component, PIN family [Kyrpidia spormannii]CAB3395559.1 Nucleic acid binding protein [Kyrpidia spormannii]